MFSVDAKGIFRRANCFIAQPKLLMMKNIFPLETSGVIYSFRLKDDVDDAQSRVAADIALR